MKDITLGSQESRFADMIWQNEPISSTELARLCLSELGWKKSTTYTVLKRLCDKGLFVNREGLVSSLISRQEFYSMQSERFVEDNFAGSLPTFLAAFTSRKKLSPSEVAQLKELVAKYEEE